MKHSLALASSHQLLALHNKQMQGRLEPDQATHSATPKSQINGSTPKSHNYETEEQNTVQSSARVVQLKREIEDLDARLAQTNSFNIEDLRQSTVKHQNASSINFQTSKVKLDQIQPHESLQKSVQSKIKGKELQQDKDSSKKENYFPQPTPELRSSVHIYQQISQNAGFNTKPLPIDTSYLTQEADVSFDYDKIAQSRSLNLKSALEKNLKDKKELIYDIQRKITQILKEKEVKNLKVTHLKFERDNIINLLQVESLKQQEQTAEAREKVKKFEIKRMEEERAYAIAKAEVKRQIAHQEGLILSTLDQVQLLMSELQNLKNFEAQQIKSSLTTSQKGLNEINEKMRQLETKITGLESKKFDVEQNLTVLKSFLKSVSEEIQMTQEDLSGKLMQRAEFVAQREELDEMYDCGRMAFGKCFELYLKINDENGAPSGSQSARYLSQEYDTQKALSFFANILQQLKQQSKTKFHDMIDSVQQKIENSSLTSLDSDKCLSWICQCASQLSIQLEKQVLQRRLELSSKEKDELFSQRSQQLKDIILEIKRFEKLIKDNSNMVDNMILPQLKAMSATYTEHKDKYKKLKQACFVLRERIKKAQRELEKTIEQRSKLENQDKGIQIKIIATEANIEKSNKRLREEEEEMDKLQENASHLDKEFRRAQQTLLLKEREVYHSIGLPNDQSVSASQSFNATQLSIISNKRQQEIEDERLKKRFNEIEDKIRIALQEREDTNIKLRDYQKLLKEAKDSCDHAEQVVLNSQRRSSRGVGYPEKANFNQANTALEEISANQVTSFTDHDAQEMPLGGNALRDHYPNMISLSSLNQVKALMGNQNKLNQPKLIQNAIKENIQQKQKCSMTKLDLSKVLACQDISQDNMTHSQLRSISQNNFYEPINYERNHDSTTLADVSVQQQNQQIIYPGFPIDYRAKEATQHDGTGNIHRHETFQDQNNSSIMNLSELIVNNNPSLQNIFQMAASHDPNTLNAIKLANEA